MLRTCLGSNRVPFYWTYFWVLHKTWLWSRGGYGVKEYQHKKYTCKLCSMCVVHKWSYFPLGHTIVTHLVGILTCTYRIISEVWELSSLSQLVLCIIDSWETLIYRTKQGPLCMCHTSSMYVCTLSLYYESRKTLVKRTYLNISLIQSFNLN